MILAQAPGVGPVLVDLGLAALCVAIVIPLIRQARRKGLPLWNLREPYGLTIPVLVLCAFIGAIFALVAFVRWLF